METVIVEGVERLHGAIKAVPSRFLTYYSLLLAALRGGRVAGIDANATATRRAIAVLQRLGASIDFSQREAVVKPASPGETTITISVQCDPFLLYTALLLAPIYLRPGGEARIVLGCRELGEAARRATGIVVQLGARPRPLWGSFSRGVVVEAVGPVKLPSMIALPPGSDSLLASIVVGILAAMRDGEGFAKFYGFLEPRSRLAQALSLLGNLGAEVEERRGLIVVKNGISGDDLDIVVPGGYAETGVFAGLAAKGYISLRGLPAELGGEEELLTILRLLGYEVEKKSDGENVEAGIGPGEGRGGVFSLTAPQLFPAVLSASLALGVPVSISGYKAFGYEEPRIGFAPKLVSLAGFRLEERGNTVLVSPSGAPRRVVDCRDKPQTLCLAVFMGLLAATSGRIVFRNIDLAYVYSDTLRTLYSLGAIIREERGG